MTSLSFGTSGLRGLVVDLLGEPTRRWTAAFLLHLENEGTRERTLLVGRDLRTSSPEIAADCLSAAEARGWKGLDCGALPTPALALEAAHRGAAAVMVTGSHIPDDRNGLKFYAPGEITKSDEAAIRQAFDSLKNVAIGRSDASAENVETETVSRYCARYLNSFAFDSLSGMTVGVYQQSSVGRDILTKILKELGADAIALGRAEYFVPVDTEAHRPEDLALLRKWAEEGQFDAIVSTDGDADRPLVADEAGHVLRGDAIGLLTARYLGAETIVTPVTSSGAMETSGVVKNVVRTRVGSPYVIEAMEAEIARGMSGVIGFEANGGVLLGTPATLAGGMLTALPTRDAVLPILSVLASARDKGLTVGILAETLVTGHALADRLKNIPATASAPFLKRLAENEAFAEELFANVGLISECDRVDGVRFQLQDGSIVHFRASGNAPELRVYVEAQDQARAEMLLSWGLAVAKTQTTMD